ncbi:hypothetical protein O181_100408 [Austropuccinia psidii MF-1]|uniref:Uncharacterized protein n=1 Tax=Austropuccinia psidii MF-1 TaxID=1389203 RepID=A0A9Q3JCP1_9BASI|nr:hypothetical protein [Austropuccinia psidii MF-1]
MFLQLAIGGAFQFMSINMTYLDDLELLTQTYDHYVHYYWYSIFHKEQKDSGSHRHTNERKAIQGARQKLRDTRYRFAINQNLPKQYIQVISPIQAHSNDEYYEPKNAYIARNLPFRSESANIFMRKLDRLISKTENDEGKRSQGRYRIHVKNPPQTMFPTAPKGLPLDFYDIKWYNSKLPAQRQNIADWKRVAFLQNPKCLLEFTSPDKTIVDQSFNDKNWEVLAKDYSLEFLSFDEPDNDNDATKEESNYGESLELDIGEEEEGKEENDEELEPVRRKEKGKARMVEDEEERSEDDNMDIDNAASNGFYGGLTEEEWNAWQ